MGIREQDYNGMGMEISHGHACMHTLHSEVLLSVTDRGRP